MLRREEKALVVVVCFFWNSRQGTPKVQFSDHQSNKQQQNRNPNKDEKEFGPRFFRTWLYVRGDVEEFVPSGNGTGTGTPPFKRLRLLASNLNTDPTHDVGIPRVDWDGVGLVDHRRPCNGGVIVDPTPFARKSHPYLDCRTVRRICIMAGVLVRGWVLPCIPGWFIICIGLSGPVLLPFFECRRRILCLDLALCRSLERIGTSSSQVFGWRGLLYRCLCVDAFVSSWTTFSTVRAHTRTRH